MEAGWHPTFIFLVGPAGLPFIYCIGLAMNSPLILNLKLYVRTFTLRLYNVKM